MFIMGVDQVEIPDFPRKEKHSRGERIPEQPEQESGTETPGSRFPRTGADALPGNRM